VKITQGRKHSQAQR